MRQKNFTGISTPETAWQNSSDWYDTLVGSSGHYFHDRIIWPKGLPLLNITAEDRVLDIACGQGVLSRMIDGKIPYTGLDASHSLIKSAQKQKLSDRHEFILADVTKKFPLNDKTYTRATIILALQNLAEPEKCLLEISRHLVNQGKLLIVLNHPHFRIPKHSSWEIDQSIDRQYRRVDKYLSLLKIPIDMNPGKSSSLPYKKRRQETQKNYTYSFHHSLHDYSRMLKAANFKLLEIQEWASDKVSKGPAAWRENQARAEFPLFMAILAEKN